MVIKARKKHTVLKGKAGAQGNAVAHRFRARDARGKMVTLKWNEPRPDLEVRQIPSRRVGRRRLGLAGIRIEAEQALQGGCSDADRIGNLRNLGPDVVQVLVKIAGSKDACPTRCRCRSGAVSVLGYFPHPVALDFLQAMVADDECDIGLRVKAVVSLGQIGSSSCVACLSSLLKQQRSIALRRAAARGLGLSKSAEAMTALETAVEEDRDGAVRLQAYAAIMNLERIFGISLTSVKEPPVPKRRRPKRTAPPKSLII